MELKGKLLDVTKDLRSGHLRLTLDVVEIPLGVDRLPEGPLSISLKQWREKRSMTANAYYWVLVGKISGLLGESQPFIHNMLLREYGQLEMVGDELVPVILPDTPEAEHFAEIDSTRHLRPTSELIRWNGKPHRVWHQLKGSSSYDTREMALLIEGTVSEARCMGIEVLPPEEIERMMESYEKHRSA